MWSSMAVVFSKAVSRLLKRNENHGLTCRLKRLIEAMSSNDKPSSKTIERVLSDETDVRSATSIHQSDFPYDREEEAQVTRREFCNFLGVTSAALFVGATGFAAKTVLESEQTESFAPAKIAGAEILSPGSALNFRYPTAKDTAILIRLSDGSYRAFGQKCTHLSCPVYFDTTHQ